MRPTSAASNAGIFHCTPTCRYAFVQLLNERKKILNLRIISKLLVILSFCLLTNFAVGCLLKIFCNIMCFKTIFVFDWFYIKLYHLVIRFESSDNVVVPFCNNSVRENWCRANVIYISKLMI